MSCAPRWVGQGAVAQLGEHLVCNQGVVGSSPISSTRNTDQAPSQLSQAPFRSPWDTQFESQLSRFSATRSADLNDLEFIDN
jgi:hypothetical protein